MLPTPIAPRAEDLPGLYAAYERTARHWVTGAPCRPEALITLSWRPGGANSVLVYGADSRSLIDIAHELDQLRSPAVIVVAGPALGNVQTIADAGWVCIGVRPFMQRRARFDSVPADPPRPGRLVFTELTTRAEMREAWRLSSAALGGETGPVASDIETLDGLRVWALREDDEIISCASTVEVEGIIGVWNVATRESRQRSGFGTRLLQSVHTACEHSSNVEHFLLHSSPSGSMLYESLGYRTIEWWQAWSRPRWVLGGA
jgi:GNAT superfamily N-acetyltransferase